MPNKAASFPSRENDVMSSWLVPLKIPRAKNTPISIFGEVWHGCAGMKTWVDGEARYHRDNELQDRWFGSLMSWLRTDERMSSKENISLVFFNQFSFKFITVSLFRFFLDSLEEKILSLHY